jgi:hypothetical protein
MSMAQDMIRQIVSHFGWQSVLDVITSYVPVISLMAVAYAVHWLPVSWKEFYRGAFIKTNLVVKLALAVLVAVIIFQVKSAELQPFIYFRF